MPVVVAQPANGSIAGVASPRPMVASQAAVVACRVAIRAGSPGLAASIWAQAGPSQVVVVTVGSSFSVAFSMSPGGDIRAGQSASCG